MSSLYLLSFGNSLVALPQNTCACVAQRSGAPKSSRSFSTAGYKSRHAGGIPFRRRDSLITDPLVGRLFSRFPSSAHPLPRNGVRSLAHLLLRIDRQIYYALTMARNNPAIESWGMILFTGFHMYRITLDTFQETVSLSVRGTSHTLRGQWAIFYLALALRSRSQSDSPPFLEAHELRLLGPWFHKKPESIGKEVARHIQSLSKWGMAEILDHDGRTRRWRLSLPSKDISLQPSEERCQTWLELQRWDLLDCLENIPQFKAAWLVDTTHALIQMEEGRIEEGLRRIRAAKRETGDSVLLGAISELVELRLLSRISRYPEPGRCLRRCAGRLGKALLLRARLAQALAPDFLSIESSIESHRKLVLQLESLPDINGLGHAHNALGVLFRRSRQLDLAKKCLSYAVALLVASCDLPTLQAALFNLGHTLAESADGEQDLRDALSIIRLDREICWALGLGRDSAQAEAVSGEVCLKLGDIQGAETWLQEGRKIVATLNSDYSKAEVERLQARILWVRSLAESNGLRQDKETILESLRSARDLLLSAGFPIDDIESEITRVRRGERPQWLG